MVANKSHMAIEKIGILIMILRQLFDCTSDLLILK